mgnify:FL=1
MSVSTLIQPSDRRAVQATAGPAMAEWLLALGPVVHRLDYGGRVAAVGGDGAAVALLAAAHPLATLDAVDAGADALAAATYDLVCALDGLAELADPVGTARRALRLVRPTGAFVVVEASRPDGFVDGPITIGGWLLRAGAARVRLLAATSHGFVLDARTTH